MLKDEWKILRQCSYYRGSEGPNIGDIEHCTFEDQEACMGEINSCRNPEALRQYLLDQGLGWKKMKGGDRCKRALRILGRLAGACLKWGMNRDRPFFRRIPYDIWDNLRLPSKLKMYFQRGPLWPGLWPRKVGWEHSVWWESPGEMSGRRKPQTWFFEKSCESLPSVSLTRVAAIFL